MRLKSIEHFADEGYLRINLVNEDLTPTVLTYQGMVHWNCDVTRDAVTFTVAVNNPGETLMSGESSIPLRPNGNRR